MSYLTFNYNLAEGKHEIIAARFEAINFLADEIRQTRDDIQSKLDQKKFLNAAMHCELLAILIRRLDAELAKTNDVALAEIGELPSSFGLNI